MLYVNLLNTSKCMTHWWIQVHWIMTQNGDWQSEYDTVLKLCLMPNMTVSPTDNWHQTFNESIKTKSENTMQRWFRHQHHYKLHKLQICIIQKQEAHQDEHTLCHIQSKCAFLRWIDLSYLRELKNWIDLWISMPRIISLRNKVIGNFLLQVARSSTPLPNVHKMLLRIIIWWRKR